MKTAKQLKNGKGKRKRGNKDKKIDMVILKRKKNVVVEEGGREGQR